MTMQNHSKSMGAATIASHAQELVEKAKKKLAVARENAVNDDDSRFVVRGNGVYFVGADSKGNKSNVRICSVVTITAETHTKKGENYGRLLEWRDSKKRLHRWAMPIHLVHGEHGEHIKKLASEGLEIVPTRFARQKLSEYIAETKTDRTCISTDRLGWNDDLFVLPDETIGEAKENETVIFQSAGGLTHCFDRKGTLAEWQENVGRLCVGNSRLVFSVAAAFSAALLAPLQEEGGGFHFNGPSSLGKSTAMRVGGSVWGGDPRHGFLDGWRTTANGAEAKAELHNDALLCLDEIKECEPKDAAKLSYMLGNGRGKERMSKSLMSQKPKTWNLIYLSSGELSLSSLIEQAGERSYDGQEVRLCDIPADTESGFGLFENIHAFPNSEAFSRQLSENSKKYYGTPIRVFLKEIIPKLEAIKTEWPVFRGNFLRESGGEALPREVQRVAARFALITFGGYLASSICGWSKDEARSACQKVFRAWLARRETNGTSDIERAIRQVRFFLEQHGSARFHDLNSPDTYEQKIVNRAGYKRKDENNETEFLIFPVTFTKEVCKGYDAKIVAKSLESRGFLAIGSDGKYSKQVKADGQNKRFYVVSSRIFEIE